MAQFSYRGIDIHLDTDGHFVAIVDDAEITTDTLALLREKLDKELKVKVEVLKAEPLALPVAVLYRGDNWSNKSRFAAHGMITGINRKTGGVMIAIATDVPKDYKADYILVDTEENRRLLAEFAEVANREVELRRKVEKQSMATSRSHSNVPYERYADLSKALEQEYARRRKDAGEAIAVKV